MEIKARSTYDYKTVKDMVRFSIFKRRSPLASLISYTVLMVACMIIVFILNREERSSYILLCTCGIIGLIGIYFMYFIMPKQRYNALKEMKDTVNKFVFEDEFINVVSDNPKYSGTAKLRYDLLSKVYETNTYYFMFQDKLQLFIVEKATIEGDSGLITNKFKESLGKKYIRCKY